jgi:hypothetical protein
MNAEIATNKPTETAAAEGATLKEAPLCQVTDLSIVQAMHKRPITATVYAYGQKLVFTGRRLTPKESNEIQELLKEAIPPRKENNEYDYDQPEFLARSRKLKLQGRAKTIWLAYEVFRTQAKTTGVEVSDLEKITNFIQSLDLADEILEALYGVAVMQPVSLIEATGFFSGNSSAKS